MARRYTIPSKPTRYRGTLFRSRLEAHWAVYFDLLGWEWRYEYTSEGWHIKPSKGEWFGIGYTPDFLLTSGPMKGWYIECKPKNPNLSELLKACLFCWTQKAKLAFAMDLTEGHGLKLTKLGIVSYQWPHRSHRYEAARHQFRRSRK